MIDGIDAELAILSHGLQGIGQLFVPVAEAQVTEICNKVIIIIYPFQEFIFIAEMIIEGLAVDPAFFSMSTTPILSKDYVLVSSFTLSAIALFVKVESDILQAPFISC